MPEPTTKTPPPRARFSHSAHSSSGFDSSFVLRHSSFPHKRILMLCDKITLKRARKITWNLSLFPKTEGFCISNLSLFEQTRTFLQTEPECLRLALSKTRFFRQLSQRTLHPTPYTLYPRFNVLRHPPIQPIERIAPIEPIKPL